MFNCLLAASYVFAPFVVLGTYVSIDDAIQNASLGALCDNGSAEDCRYLANRTDGNCASPGAIHGCKFDSLN